MTFLKPKILESGDVVRVVASSSAFDEDSLWRGIEALESLGLTVRYQKNIFAKHAALPYLAGTDQRRYQELKAALTDDDTKAIFFARGGYGAMRLIPFFEADSFARLKPKIIAGLSDVTALHLYFQKRFRWTVFYAPVVGGNMGQLQNPESFLSLQKNLMQNQQLGPLRFRELHVVKKGVATAPLVGGCLTLVAGSLGTPYEINTDDKILFLEDVGETPYQIDRLLMQLKMAGKFKKCCGVILGPLVGSTHPANDYINTIRDVLSDIAGPVVMNFPTGHVAKSITLPLGARITLTTKTKTVDFLESALR